MKKRMKTEETKEKGEMKTSFSYPFYMNPHPLCHCFSIFFFSNFRDRKSTRLDKND